MTQNAELWPPNEAHGSAGRVDTRTDFAGLTILDLAAIGFEGDTDPGGQRWQPAEGDAGYAEGFRPYAVWQRAALGEGVRYLWASSREHAKQRALALSCLGSVIPCDPAERMPLLAYLGRDGRTLFLTTRQPRDM